MKMEDLLPRLRKPGRYLGTEYNAVRKDWDTARVRIVLGFSDLYEIGMSHLGIQILYHLVNRHHGFLAERVFTPDLDLEDLLKEHGLALCSLESRRPIRDFDLFGISLPYELCHTNVLTMLDLAGIPFLASERSEDQPLVIAGGAGVFNPEPVADFFDAIVLGDGEEAIIEILEIVAQAKESGKTRKEVLNLLAGIEGCYVPSHFLVRYQEDGRIAAISSRIPGVTRVRRRILADLDKSPPPYPPLVPYTKIVHDRLGIEIARGCTRGCRFCQAGIIYRPVRERSPEKILALAQEGLTKSGFEELALLSLSTGDYSCLSEVLTRLMDTYAGEQVSISLPSMRVGTLTEELMRQIKRVRKTGFTLAPEAGSEALRQAINKGITEKDLLSTCCDAFALGWRLIKLYFMFGLPHETWADIEAIPALARRLYQDTGAGKTGGRITVSAATFVPKAHTPFQWEPQLSLDEAYERLAFLKRATRGRGLTLKWHDPRQSFLEGVIARGDRRLAPLIVEAWKRGSRLDAWTDHFHLPTWEEAATFIGLDLSWYLRQRNPAEILPWDHLDVGVDREFLSLELKKAARGEYTPDCRVHGCQQCGLCDFKHIRPLLSSPGKMEHMKAGLVPPVGDKAKPHFTYRLFYRIREEARFLGHLELMDVFFRAFRRIRLPLSFSQGFNPTPRVSFSPALPLGTESMAEYMDIELTRPLSEPVHLLTSINKELAPGLLVTAIGPPEKIFSSSVQITGYLIYTTRSLAPEKLAEFLARDSYPLALARKDGVRTIDVRPLVHSFKIISEGKIELVLHLKPGKAGVKPMELINDILGLSEEESPACRIVKVHEEWLSNSS